jgi:tetratricopeptide (TPR) repeat protein
VAVAAVLIGLVLSASGAETPAPSDTDLLNQAQASFREGTRLRDRPEEARRCFRQAADAYETLRQRGAANAALFRNQGNASLLAGDLPGAILAYRRGLRCDPNDRVLRNSLEQARAQVAYPESDGLGRPSVDHWPPWLPRPSQALLAGSALLLYGLGLLMLTRWWMTRRGRWLRLAVTALSSAALVGAAWGVGQWQASDEAQHPLVVIAADGVLLRRGNGLTYPPRYQTPVNRGVEARLLFDRGQWLKIELAGSESGWVPRAAVIGSGERGGTMTAVCLPPQAWEK